MAQPSLDCGRGKAMGFLGFRVVPLSELPHKEKIWQNVDQTNVSGSLGVLNTSTTYQSFQCQTLTLYSNFRLPVCYKYIKNLLFY